MASLVMIVPGSGPNHPDSMDSAKRLYSDLISKTECDRIVVLREDSVSESPTGLRELAESKGLTIITKAIHRSDPSSFTGNEDPEKIWSDQLSAIISNVGIDLDDPKNSYLIGPGSGWNTSLLSCLRRIVGGRLWTSLASIDGEASVYELVFEDLSEDALSTFAAAGALCQKGNDAPFQAGLLQGNADGLPANPGVENTFRPYPELVTRQHDDESDSTTFLLTPRGKIRSILALAEMLAESPEEIQKRDPDTPQSGRKGLILASRNSNQARTTVEYIREHFSALNFDRFAIIVNRHGSDDDELEQISQSTNEELLELLKEDSLVTPTHSHVDASQDIASSHYRLLSLIHQIREDNDEVEWSLELSNFLAPLRPAAIEYAGYAKIPSFCMMKNPNQPGGGIFPSNLSGMMHRHALPSSDQIDKVRKIYASRSEDLRISVFTANMALMDLDSPGTVLSSESKSPLMMYEWNRRNLPSGHPMRWGGKSDASQRKTMSVVRKSGIANGAFCDSKTEFVITAEGVVASYLLGEKIGGET